MSRLLLATATKPGEMRRALSRRDFFLVVSVFLLIIGTVLRVYHLGDRSLWYDEAVTANASDGTFTQVLEETRLFSAPVIHPSILYLAEKVGKSPDIVRAPSVLASLFAVFMMLAMVRVKVSQDAALFSAAILAVSSSQIRYAQEVREYSLAVLIATVLIFSLLKWETSGSRSNHPILLYVALFIAPLVQYGVVLFAFAILGTVVLRLLLTRSTCFSLSRAAVASAFLVAGGLLSFFLTLRYQFHAGGTQWYLEWAYFDSKTIGFLRFLISNSWSLLIFLIPGRVIDLCFVISTIIFCILQIRDRKLNTITLLIFTSVSITVCASVARVYPYGGVRQCLFLAPVLALFTGIAFADLLARIKESLRPVAVAGLMALIMLSLFRGVLNEWPYGEIEDTQSILKELAKSMAPNDQVWVNHDAVAAFRFYQQKKDRRFIYGIFHANATQYNTDLLASIDPHSDRLWLVFSHLEQQSDRTEEQLIVNSLRPRWNVHSVIAPTNTELYFAHRRTSP
jgi:uncharacterized membrane protein